MRSLVVVLTVCRELFLFDVPSLWAHSSLFHALISTRTWRRLTVQCDSHRVASIGLCCFRVSMNARIVNNFFTRVGLFRWRPFFTIGHRHPSSIDVTELVGPCASAMPIERLLHETRVLAFTPFSIATGSRLRLLRFVMHAALLCRTLFAVVRCRCTLLLV